MSAKFSAVVAASVIAGCVWAQDVAALSPNDETLHADALTLFQPIPTAQPAPQNNPVTREKVELGKMLFFDPRLSASHLLSCNTCHNLSMGGVDGLETSVGHDWQRNSRNVPTIFNAVFNAVQAWDGRAADLREQAKGPIQAAVEMNATPDRVLAVLNSMPEYQRRFALAFPGEAEPVTFDNVVKVIEVFEVTLITPGSRFDQFLEGNLAALDAGEKHGLQIFIEKGCAACHNGVNLGGSDYYDFASKDTETDEADAYVFRAPPLRNVALTAPYFHSGNVWDLKQAVEIMSISQLGVDVTGEEVDAIVAFLRTLTGKQPTVSFPVLPPNAGSTPRPVLMTPEAAAEAK